MHLEAGHVHDRHARKSVHGATIASQQNGGRVSTGRVLATGFAARQDDTGRHSFHVPLEWPANGFVKVVDVEYQPAIGCRVGAQIAYMCVSAELGKDAGVGQHRQVSGHDRNGPAKKTKRRSRHSLPLDREQRRHTSHSGGGKSVDRIGLPVRGFPSLVLLTAHLLAPGLSKGAPFLGRE
jgi:hypothetical protein